jgi:hypothetical protein
MLLVSCVLFVFLLLPNPNPPSLLSLINSPSSGTTLLNKQGAEPRSRAMLVVPYCSKVSTHNAVSGRLAAMIEALSISSHSKRAPLLNWVTTPHLPATFTQLFDSPRTPFETVYLESPMPESIDKEVLDTALAGSSGPLILSVLDLPWLSTTIKARPPSFVARQAALFSRKASLRGGEHGKGEGNALIYAGCHARDIKAHSNGHVESALSLVSSVSCSILSEVSRSNILLRLMKKHRGLAYVVTVVIDDDNSPLVPGSSWPSLAGRVNEFKHNSLIHVVSPDPNVGKWFCEHYDNAVSLEASNPVLARHEAGSEKVRTALIELLTGATMDYVISDADEDGASSSSSGALLSFLAENKIVWTVLQQQSKEDCVRKVDGRDFASVIQKGGDEERGKCYVSYS